MGSQKDSKKPVVRGERERHGPFTFWLWPLTYFNTAAVDQRLPTS